MNRQYIDDHHIVARYLADQLADGERDAFEAYFLEHPEILREIEATARFKAGLAQLQASGELAALMKPTPWYRHWRHLAVAAVAMVVIGVAFLVARSTPPAIVANVSALGSTSIASSYTVLRRRGGLFDAEVTLPAASEAVELRVVPEFTSPDARYRIALSRIDADDKRVSVGEIEHLSVADDGMVAIYLDSARIAPGDYAITLANDNASEPGQTSKFLVRVSR